MIIVKLGASGFSTAGEKAIQISWTLKAIIILFHNIFFYLTKKQNQVSMAANFFSPKKILEQLWIRKEKPIVSPFRRGKETDELKTNGVMTMTLVVRFVQEVNVAWSMTKCTQLSKFSAKWQQGKKGCLLRRMVQNLRTERKQQENVSNSKTVILQKRSLQPRS